MLQPVDPFHLLYILTFGAVAVPSGVVGMLLVSTLIAFMLMSGERRSPATGQICKHLLLAWTKPIRGFEAVLMLDQQFPQVKWISLIFHSHFI